MQGYGDSEDSWNLAGKSKFGLNSNPAPVPVLTLQSNQFFNSQNPPTSSTSPYVFSSFENRTIHLNNLSIEILSETPNYTLPLNTNGVVPKDVKIKVKWDDVNITDNVRWCASDIQLHPTTHAIVGALDNPTEYSLNITGGHSVTLDRGASPTQHIAYDADPNGTWRFTQPTTMTCLANSYFNVEPNGNLYLRNGSTLTLKNGSKLQVSGIVHVEYGSKLIIENGAELKIMAGGLVHVEDGGQLIIQNSTAGKGIQFASSGVSTARLLVEGKLVFQNGADWVHDGYGYYDFQGVPQLLLGPGSDVNLNGNGKTVIMLKIGSTVQIVIDGHPTTIKNGRIEYSANSMLWAKNTSLDVDYVEVAGSLTSSTSLRGTNLSLARIQHTDISYSWKGILLENIPNTVQALIKYCTISGCELGAEGVNVFKFNVENTTVQSSPTATGIKFTDCKVVKVISSTLYGLGTGINLVNVKGFLFRCLNNRLGQLWNNR